MGGRDKFEFAIDRGGTFTDVYARCPGGKIRVMKLLSVDPANYDDAPREGIRRILEQVFIYGDNLDSIGDNLKKFAGDWEEDRRGDRRVVDIVDSNGNDSRHERSFGKKRRENGAVDQRRIQRSSFHRESSTPRYIRLGSSIYKHLTYFRINHD